MRAARSRTGVALVVSALLVSLLSPCAQAAGGDYLDYTDYTVGDTVIGLLHVCDGMTSTYRYTADKGVELEIMWQDTYPTIGGKVSIGYQQMTGVSSSASITNDYVNYRSSKVKTGLRYRLEHWAHVDPYPSPPKAGTNGDSRTSSLPPGVVTKRWDVCKVDSNPGYALTRGDPIGGDDAPAAQLCRGSDSLTGR